MLRVLLLAATWLAATQSSGQEIDPKEIPPELAQPIFEKSDADLDTCGLGAVSGLDPDGDGFLSVRTGPGTEYARLAKLANGDRVWIFDTVGEWHGVIYGAEAVDCSPITETRVLNRDGANHGWIHSNWLTPLAG
ncbi:SH3 domain-containing protein [Phaeobacter sp. C3_T13_0]|uniref:SH3 domain-containing protein n=1 Tax=Phaeobacter cretensis TaxID=3342641 RepID=UPI0039BC28A5